MLAFVFIDTNFSPVFVISGSTHVNIMLENYKRDKI